MLCLQGNMFEGETYTHSDYDFRTAKEVMTVLDTPGGKCTFGDHMYVWPFPLSEMDINPELDQKPGY